MKKGGRLRTSYNGQIAVDENQIIVAAEVTIDPSDTEQLIPMVEQAERRIGPLDSSVPTVVTVGRKPASPGRQKDRRPHTGCQLSGCAGARPRRRDRAFSRDPAFSETNSRLFYLSRGSELTFVRMQKVKNKKLCGCIAATPVRNARSEIAVPKVVRAAA